MKLTVEKLVEIIKEQFDWAAPDDDSMMAAARAAVAANAVDQDDVDRYHTQRRIAANAEKLKANDYDQDDIDQLRSKASNLNQDKVINFLFGGWHSAPNVIANPSELQPLEQFTISDFFKVISDLGFEGREAGKIFDAASKLFHKNFVSVVEEMATGFQLRQLGNGSLFLVYKFGDAEKMKRVMTKYIKKAILAAGHNLGIDRSLLARAKSALGLEETKMKITQEQVMNIIKEEIAAVLGEEVNSLLSAADPRIPIIILRDFIQRASGAIADDDGGRSIAGYFKPEQGTDITGQDARWDSGATDSPRTVGAGMLDVFSHGLTSIEDTIRHAIEQSGVDASVQKLMDMVFTSRDMTAETEPSMKQVLEMAQVLLESLKSVEIPNAENPKDTLDDLRHYLRQPELADKIEKELP